MLLLPLLLRERLPLARLLHGLPSGRYRPLRLRRRPKLGVREGYVSRALRLALESPIASGVYR